MIARLRQAMRRDDGASAVEFAFIGTLIVLPLVFGAISFGMVFAGNLSASNAARQAARIGTVIGADSANPNSCGDIVTEAESAMPAIGLVKDEASVEVLIAGSAVCATNSSGAYTTGSASTVPCLDTAVDTQVLVYVRSETTFFFIPPYYFKTSGYPVEGKGVYRCEFS